MNFITRHLGWILLALFFAFMLFLISTNNSQDSGFKTSTGVMMGTGEKNLDHLEEKIGDKNISQTQESLVSQEAVTSDTKESLSFFERLFGKKVNKDTIVSNTGISATGSDATIEQTNPSKQNSITVSVKGVNTGANQNLVKNTNTTQTSYISPELGSSTSGNIELPGRKLDTYNGKKYEVAVNALKLNNSTFSQTLAYLKKGDIVKQIGDTNIQGCFGVEVETSMNTKNIGKTGYVCKKYLQDISPVTPNISPVTSTDTIRNNTGSIDNSTQEKVYPVTNIGDIITIGHTAQLILKEYTDLSKGDKIDQMTNIDAAGCFIAHVYASAYETSRDMVGRICQRDIY